MDYLHIAVVDLETSDLDPYKGEILEIGAVLADGETLETIRELSLKVQPQHIDTADPEALRVNGYQPEDWEDAVTLADAMRQFSETVRNAEIAVWNLKFDWPFLAAAFHATGVQPAMSVLALVSRARSLVFESTRQPRSCRLMQSRSLRERPNQPDHALSARYPTRGLGFSWAPSTYLLSTNGG